MPGPGQPAERVLLAFHCIYLSVPVLEPRKPRQCLLGMASTYLESNHHGIDELEFAITLARSFVQYVIVNRGSRE